MNKVPLIIIKLGGSVITDKRRDKGVFRGTVVFRIAEEISQAKKKNDFDLILVHGAGSFGHPLAKKYNLHKGYLGSKSIEGFTKTKKAIFDLSLLVWREAERVGLNACIVHSGEVIVTSSGEIRIFDTRFIQALIAKKMTPILFGDVVFDDKMGFSVISGDAIVAHLAKKFKANKVIFVSDVDGVFDKNPKVYQNAKLIRYVNESNYLKIIEGFESSGNHDVTGEMKGKILEIKGILSNLNVQIVNGLRSNVIKRALNGGQSGTLLIFKKKNNV